MTDMVGAKAMIYTLPMCHKCDRTIEHMKKLGIDYETVDLSEDPSARQKIKDLYGFSTAPVVVTDDDVWCDYKPDKIKALAR